MVVRFPTKARNCSVLRRAQAASGTHVTPLVGALDSGVKRPGREDDHSVPYTATVKHEWSCASIPLHLHDVHRDNYTCTYRASDSPFFGARPVNFDKVARR